MKHRLSTSDREFLAHFESCRLDPSDFHHRQHLRLADCRLARLPLEEARLRLKEDLLRFLGHHGIDPAAYHETLTVGWLLAVRHFMNESPPAGSWREFIEGNGALLDKEILFSHYSRDLVASATARASFVPPDLEPIPGQQLALA